ncbi:hypothetical protein CLG96_01100 [Sphingomonas oleivorans]|uniref:Uncharacterized protein n=1 Tax=Sphingomonas oleivorans TaxID=1735121 RepID=A0A2T5G0V4_9SPHN|nr:hypothetical protein [Sphingomonas oleivorans]PTQ12777.1 hypothetical protein CLG96_01100 [Sphingomonas oleivorans]
MGPDRIKPAHAERLPLDFTLLGATLAARTASSATARAHARIEQAGRQHGTYYALAGLLRGHGAIDAAASLGGSFHPFVAHSSRARP